MKYINNNDYNFILAYLNSRKKILEFKLKLDLDNTESSELILLSECIKILERNRGEIENEMQWYCNL